MLLCEMLFGSLECLLSPILAKGFALDSLMSSRQGFHKPDLQTFFSLSAENPAV